MMSRLNEQMMVIDEGLLEDSSVQLDLVFSSSPAEAEFLSQLLIRSFSECRLMT